MRRVVKVGGSLLLQSKLAESLREWIAGQPAAQTLVIFGGGELIEAIRRLDQLRPGDPGEVHWRCVELLQATFDIASSWLVDWPRIDTTGDFDEALAAITSGSPATLVSVRSFYRRDSGSQLRRDPGDSGSQLPGDSGSQLPLNWSTTTDSIAAELAVKVGADELVLLKSCDVDPEADALQLARKGIVDPVFPRVAGKLPAFRVERLC